VKRKSILYIFYCIAIIVIIALFLIFHFKPQNVFGGADNNQNDKQYAKSLVLNCARELTMGRYCEINLKNDYLSVTPASKLKDVSYKITNKHGDIVTGLTFANNVITATKVGYYQIIFSVASSDKSILQTKLSVNVIDDAEDDRLTCNNNLLMFGQTAAFTDIFSLRNENAQYDVDINDKNIINYADGQFTAISSGYTDLKVYIKSKYIDYIYSYCLFVRDEPEYRIETECDDNVITNLKRYSIYYHVLDLNSLEVEQSVNVKISDAIIAKLISNNSPVIQIEFLVKGSVDVIITSTLDESVVKTITITYE